MINWRTDIENAPRVAGEEFIVWASGGIAVVTWDHGDTYQCAFSGN
jgi:hypothetical protein